MKSTHDIIPLLERRRPEAHAVRAWDDQSVAGVINAADGFMVELFSGLSVPQFSKLVRELRREGADPTLKGRPWNLAFEDRVLLVAAYGRTNLTMRQIAVLFGTSKSAADRIIDDLAPKLALRPRKRYAPETVLIVDGTLVPTRDHSVAAKSKSYRYSTNHQVAIRADTRFIVAVGTPLPGNRNDSGAFTASGVDHATRTATTIADGGYQGTSPRPSPPQGQGHPAHRLEGGTQRLPRKVRARIEHTFAKMKTWKILRDCRLRGSGSAEAMVRPPPKPHHHGLNSQGSPMLAPARKPSATRPSRNASNASPVHKLKNQVSVRWR
jgi:hypothetical protein